MHQNEAFQAIVNGNAILFCGAGFSIGVNSKMGPLPSGRSLAKELFLSATGREPMDDFDNIELSQVAEYFEQQKGRDALVQFLIERFTVCDVPNEQKSIIHQPWRRVYTTNYDDCFESALSRPKRLKGVTTEASIDEYKNSPNLVVHINGFINEPQSKFILSNTDYATQTFVDSPWWHVFRQDIAEAEAIFFIGYSLYDLDITRALVRSDALKAKIFFCNGKSIDPITTAKFNSFGTLLSDFGLNEIVSSLKDIEPVETILHPLKSMQKIVTPIGIERISDREVNDLLLWGICPDKNLWHALENSKSRPAVTRTAIHDAIAHLTMLHDVVFHGGMVSGKSIAARQLGLQLRSQGFEVFLVVSSDRRFLREDLAFVLNTYNEAIIIFDGVIRNHDDILWFLRNRRERQRIVCIENTQTWLGDERIIRIQTDNHFRDLQSYNLEKLDTEEINSFVDLFESTGMWADEASLSIEAKRRKLSVEFEGNVRSVLLSFVRSKYVKEIVLREIRETCITDGHKKILATAFLLSSLDVRPNETELESLSGLPARELSRVLKEDRIQWLVNATTSGISSKSLCVGYFFLTEFCSPPEVLRWLLQLNKESARLYHTSYTMQELQKQLGRFQPIQRLLPRAEDTTQAAIETYFDSIKDVGKRTNDPLFWMHYSMVFTFRRDWESAKRCIETSRSIAKKRGFDPFQIETQYSRFLLEGIIDLSPDAETAVLAFMEAKRIIDHMIAISSNRHYPFRVAELYGTFYLQYKSRLTEAQRGAVKGSITRTIEAIARLPKDLANHYDVSHCRKILNEILKNEAKEANT